jgi:hypothetical protein
MPNQPGQEERTNSFHNESTAREDETDLRIGVRYAYIHGECHGDADAYCRTLESGYGGFAAVLDG